MVANLIENPKEIKRHVVILGAGASLATTIPTNGDRNGKRLPIMNNLIKVIGIEDLVHDFKSDNFEDIYSELYSKRDYTEVLETIEKSVYDYFSSLELPDEPTIYDYLVLSLRRKDVIATFLYYVMLGKDVIKLLPQLSQ
ncbi:hypothetical protein [Bacillus smithii]|uniref:hypothetical protein n=1 Tax=Bacillus smithii TaxID=1479 RepID=UPI003D19012B